MTLDRFFEEVYTGFPDSMLEFAKDSKKHLNSIYFSYLSPSERSIDNWLDNELYSIVRRMDEAYSRNINRQAGIENLVLITPKARFLDSYRTLSPHLTNSHSNEEIYLVDGELALSSERGSFTNIIHSRKDSNGVSHPLAATIKLNEEWLHNKIVREFSEGVAERLKVIGVYLVYTFYSKNSYESAVLSAHLVSLSLEGIIGKRLKFSLKNSMRDLKETFVERFFSSFMSKIRDNYTSVNREVEDYKTRLGEALRQLQPLDYMIKSSDEILDKIKKSLEDARNINGIVDCWIDREENFFVEMEHIYIKQENYEDMYWDIGKLTFKVKNDGKTYCYNSTRRVRGWENYKASHPHTISEDQYVCLGDISVVVLELYKKYEYASLAGILLNFARSVNLSDVAGQTITRWPTVQLKNS